jgi:uncharacterized protein YqjF (DUF2071 family)
MTITTVGRLEDCVLLSYRTPAERVRHLVPRGLELMTHGGFAFWNVVACHVVAMRPRGLRAVAGMSFHQVAYRLYVRAGEESGLYFVRSDVDSRLVSTTGNWMTDFRFHPATIRRRHEPGAIRYDVTDAGDGNAAVCVASAAAANVHADSCFASAAEAARVLKYRPVAFAPDDEAKRVRLAEVFRDERRWEEKPVSVVEARFGLFDALGQDELVLERAIVVAPLDYRWRLGRRLSLRSENPNDDAPVNVAAAARGVS